MLEFSAFLFSYFSHLCIQFILIVVFWLCSGLKGECDHPAFAFSDFISLL